VVFSVFHQLSGGYIFVFIEEFCLFGILDVFQIAQPICF